MVYKFQNSRSSKRIGFVSLIIATILLASCPDPIPQIPLATGNFNTLASRNGDPQAIWSDGTTMWVSDSTAERIFAYNMHTKEPDRGNYIDTAGANINPLGIWADGTTMWVANRFSGGLYAYNLKSGNPDTNKNFTALSRNPHGIWSDGTTIWEMSTQSGNLLGRQLGGSRGRDSARDINGILVPPDRFAKDIWTDGTTIWVSMANVRIHRIDAYNFTPGRGAVKDMDKSFEMDDLIDDNAAPFGIWSDGTTMWVLDKDERKIFAYNLKSKEYTPE